MVRKVPIVLAHDLLQQGLGWVRLLRPHSKGCRDHNSCSSGSWQLFEDRGAFPKLTFPTRLHPQGKGGPQAILCGQRLKTWTKSENVPTKQIQKSTIFERSTIYCSWTFGAKKCVFDTSCGTLINGKWKKCTIPKFQLFADALTVPPKNRVRGASTQWQKSQQIRRRRRHFRRTHKSKRRPHKMPFGQ